MLFNIGDYVTRESHNNDLVFSTGYIIAVLSLSRRRPRRRRGRGGGSPFESRRRRPQSGVDGFPSRVAGGGMRPGCRGTRTRDNPSDRCGRRREGSLHQRVGCGPPAAGLQSGAQSVPTHRGTPGHCRCQHGTGHAPEYTSSYSSWVRVG